MSTGDNHESVSIRRTAWRGIRKHFNEITTVAVVTVLLRIAAFLPMLLCVDFGGKLPTWMGLVAAATVYVVGPIPMRFWGREKMRRVFYSRHLNHRHKNIYKKWLKTGLLRYARGILWGIPFLAGLVYFTVFRRTLDAKTFWMPVRNLAVLVGQEANLGTGMLVTLFLMIVFGLMFAHGWGRDLPIEYLTVRSLEAMKTLHWSRRIVKNHKKEIRRNTFQNFLLSLPVLIGLGAVLVPYVRANVDFSMSADMTATQILRLLRTPLPTAELLKLAAVAAVLYVPFWIFRKTSNAALIGKLMKEKTHTSHSADYKEVSVTPPAAAKKVDFQASMGSNEKKQKLPHALDDTLEKTLPPALDDSLFDQTDEKDDFAQDADRIAQDDDENGQE